MKLTQIYPKRSYETVEEQSAAGRFNPATVLTYNDARRLRLTIGAGTDDYVEVFSDGGEFIYVVSTNYRLGYMGLQIFHDSGEYSGQLSGEIFLQSEEDIRNAVGPRGLDLAGRNIAKRLAEHIY